MVLLVTDVFLLLTQILLWILVGLAARFVILKALPKAFLGGLVLALLVVVTALTFFSGVPQPGLLGDLWQLIAVLFNPLGLILVFLCVVWSDAESKKGLNLTSKLLLRIGVISLLVMSIPLFANFAMQRSELEAIAISRPEVPGLNAGGQRVVVLMAKDTTRLGLHPPSKIKEGPIKAPDRNAIIQPAEPISSGNISMLADQVQLTESGDRILQAANVFRKLGANYLVVSANQYPGRGKKDGETWDGVSEATEVKKILRDRFGIPDGAILVDAEGSTVQSSAANVRRILEKANINPGGQLTVVTSALQASRTALTFKREFDPVSQNFAIISRPTDFYTIPPKDALESRLQGSDLVERNLGVIDLIPTTESLDKSSKVMTEALTSLYYFLRGWIRPLRAA
jgi:hypothetical protein